MLTLKTLGPNCHEVTDGETSILFSYATPVAAHIMGRGYFRTDAYHSVTTARHINAYVGGPKQGEVIPADALQRASLSILAQGIQE